MPRDYKLYLEDILEAVERVSSYVQNISTREQFVAERMRVDAVLYWDVVQNKLPELHVEVAELLKHEP
jgi:uncharacterized protein with HEPN domain